MDKPDQEKFNSNSKSQSLGSQDSWSTENSDSQNSLNSWLTDSSQSSCSEEELWNEAK